MRQLALSLALIPSMAVADGGFFVDDAVIGNTGYFYKPAESFCVTGNQLGIKSLSIIFPGFGPDRGAPQLFVSTDGLQVWAATNVAALIGDALAVPCDDDAIPVALINGQTNLSDLLR